MVRRRTWVASAVMGVSGGGRWRAARGDLPRHALAVAPRAEDEHRAERVLEQQTGEVEAGAVVHGAALLLGKAVVANRKRKAAARASGTAAAGRPPCGSSPAP